ncbi:hypothetical protein N658DRAFT_203743 [Parathielavia hyrcaniae]|uniref:Secreted protein n=1 Tax=Parathielavia hyrcaniae TaxID=113614 RepID=A0AAN6Q122_9PEZI|nr:hypothetical protein N658DRAFT_203743 [Parathielavia hyrcaniae]
MSPFWLQKSHFRLMLLSRFFILSCRPRILTLPSPAKQCWAGKSMSRLQSARATAEHPGSPTWATLRDRVWISAVTGSIVYKLLRHWDADPKPSAHCAAHQRGAPLVGYRLPLIWRSTSEKASRVFDLRRNLHQGGFSSGSSLGPAHCRFGSVASCHAAPSARNRIASSVTSCSPALPP